VSTVVAEYADDGCGRRREDVDSLVDDAVGDTQERAEAVGEDEWSREELSERRKAEPGVFISLLGSAEYGRETSATEVSIVRREDIITEMT
jgi:hypothetical protein